MPAQAEQPSGIQPLSSLVKSLQDLQTRIEIRSNISPYSDLPPVLSELKQQPQALALEEALAAAESISAVRAQVCASELCPTMSIENLEAEVCALRQIGSANEATQKRQEQEIMHLRSIAEEQRRRADEAEALVARLDRERISLEDENARLRAGYGKQLGAWADTIRQTDASLRREIEALCQNSAQLQQVSGAASLTGSEKLEHWDILSSMEALPAVRRVEVVRDMAHYVGSETATRALSPTRAPRVAHRIEVSSPMKQARQACASRLLCPTPMVIRR